MWQVFFPLACKEIHKDSLIWSLNFREDCPSSVHCDDHKDIPPSKIQRITLQDHKQINLKKSKHHIMLSPEGKWTWLGPGIGRGLRSQCWGSAGAGGHGLWWRLFTPVWEEVKLLQPSCRYPSCSTFLLMVEFQWFLMELSVLLGISLAFNLFYDSNWKWRYAMLCTQDRVTVQEEAWRSLPSGCQAVCGPRRWFDPLPESMKTSSPQGWGGCASVHGTAFQSSPGGA